MVLWCRAQSKISTRVRTGQQSGCASRQLLVWQRQSFLPSRQVALSGRGRLQMQGQRWAQAEEHHQSCRASQLRCAESCRLRVTQRQHLYNKGEPHCCLVLRVRLIDVHVKCTQEHRATHPSCMSAVSMLQVYVQNPVLCRCWPTILEGRDVQAVAEPGSGKTFGYLLPTVPWLLAKQGPGRPPRSKVLVLVPTRWALVIGRLLSKPVPLLYTCPKQPQAL